ncbi:hypothetical protein R5R35_000894 [Gryllus longicercus]|uniref:Alpha 1,4-glycosyltransferase domain-containing protein n=1 Tax=Gryllus longicercus TaxID=2509291 RepID=A0AAN9VZI4_9ORTH
MRVLLARPARVTACTALLLLGFVLVAAYAGLLAPRRPLFGWVRVVALDFDAVTGGPAPGARNVFLVEASCALDDSPPAQDTAESGLVLSPRAACALESAARAHPSHSVYLVHTCPVDVEATWRGAAPAHALAALTLPNVFVWPAPPQRLLRHSALDALQALAARHAHADGRAPWPLPYASLLLRYFLLWKYGGLYLDSDVFVLKALDAAGGADFAVAEGAAEVSGSALAFSWGATGRRVAAACLNDSLLLRPEGASRVHAADQVVTHALARLCGSDKVSEMTAARCQGFRVLAPSAVAPVPQEEWFRLFSEEGAEETLRAVAASAAVHTWQQRSGAARVDPGSGQPLAHIARDACPAVLAALDGQLF